MDGVRAALEDYVAAVRDGLESERRSARFAAESDGRDETYETVYYRVHLAQAELLAGVLAEGGVGDPRVKGWLSLERHSYATSFLPDEPGERAEEAFLRLARTLESARDG